MGKRPLKIEETIALLAAWAVGAGCEKQALTNPYELVRLRVAGGVAIVYRKDSGKTTWNPLAAQLRHAFESGEPFPPGLRLVAKTPYVRDKKTRSIIHQTLIERDGEGCFFCFEEKPQELMSIEHLVARAHGGPDHISNKFRACTPCNGSAGHLSAPEKIRIREAALLRRATAEPSQTAA